MPTTTPVVATAAFTSIPQSRAAGAIGRSAWTASLALAALLASAPGMLAASEIFPDWHDSFCDGRCAATVLVGRQLNTGLAHADGTASFTPPWKYEYGDSGIIAGALSYSVVELYGMAAIEVEAGVGQRFGKLHEQEGWVAIYARWKWFPWDRYLRTSFALSTGLNYASGVTDYETSETPDKKAMRLLHYFSPELTFGLPSKPDTDFVIRFHHRSGGGDYFGNEFPVYGTMFRGSQGGMQYLTFGLRRHF